MGERLLFGRLMIWCPPRFWRGAEDNITNFDPNKPYPFSDYGIQDVSRLNDGSCWDGQPEYYKYFKTGQPYPNHVRPMSGIHEWVHEGMNAEAMPQTPDLTGYNVNLEEASEDHPEYFRFIVDHCLKFGITPDLMIPSAPDNPDHSEAQPDYDGDLFSNTWYYSWQKGNAYFRFADYCESRGLYFTVSPISSGHPKRILKAFIDRGYKYHKRIDGRIVFINYENIYPNTLAFRSEIEAYVGEGIFIIGKGEAVDIRLENLFLQTLIDQPESASEIYRQLSIKGKPWCPFIVPSVCRVMGAWGKLVIPFNEIEFEGQWRIAKHWKQHLNPEWGIDCLAYLYENNWWENTVWVKTVQNGDAVMRICQEEMNNWNAPNNSPPDNHDEENNNGDEDDLNKEEVREILLSELWKISISNFWTDIVMENIRNHGIDLWFLRLPHGGEFWAIEGSTEPYNYLRFLRELPEHIGKENEPNWALMKLNV